MWSLFLSVRVYMSLHFLFILLGFRLSVFWFFMFTFLWFLVFIFSVLFSLFPKVVRCTFLDIGRHFSHVTKSRIFKNPNLRRKADRNFRGNFPKNHFRHLKFYSKRPSWLDGSRCDMSAIWNTKGWSSHFWQGQSFRFFDMGVHCQRRLNPRKQIFLLNLRLWSAQKPKIWSFFYRKKFTWENYVV